MDSNPDYKCTLIVPAYNEERRIEIFLSDITSYKGPVIFVCDGSDKTADIVLAFAQENPGLNFKILKFEERLGKGGGITEGIKACDTEYVGFTDADGSTPVPELRKLFSYLRVYDCAIGSRWLKESKIGKKQKFFRRLESRLFNLSTRILFQMSFSDTQCGAKVFRTESVKRILPDVRSNGFEFDVEVLYLLLKGGFSVKEIPISWNDREESHVGSSDGVGMLINLIKIRLNR